MKTRNILLFTFLAFLPGPIQALNNQFLHLPAGWSIAGQGFALSVLLVSISMLLLIGPQLQKWQTRLASVDRRNYWLGLSFAGAIIVNWLL